MDNIEKKNGTELNEKELEKAAGGADVVTRMRCDSCGCDVSWDGNYLGIHYDCSRCGAKNAFYGYLLDFV